MPPQAGSWLPVAIRQRLMTRVKSPTRLIDLYGTRVSAAGHLAAPELDDLLLLRWPSKRQCRLRRLRMAVSGASRRNGSRP